MGEHEPAEPLRMELFVDNNGDTWRIDDTWKVDCKTCGMLVRFARGRATSYVFDAVEAHIEQCPGHDVAAAERVVPGSSH